MNHKGKPNSVDELLDKSFPIQWVYKGKKYGFSPSAFKSRIRCWFTHLPLTRKHFQQWHDLNCGSLIIAPLDNWIGGKEMMHEMRERGFEL